MDFLGAIPTIACSHLTTTSGNSPISKEIEMQQTYCMGFEDISVLRV